MTTTELVPVSNQAVVIPKPGQALVPKGWCDEVIVPWLEKTSDTVELTTAAAQLDGLAAAYRTLKADTFELVKARRRLELRWGELLGPAQARYSDDRQIDHVALRRLRRSKGFTQVSLAEAAGLTFYTTNRLEQGPAMVRRATVEKLAEALGVPAYEFSVDAGRSSAYNAALSDDTRVVFRKLAERADVVLAHISKATDIEDLSRNALVRVAKGQSSGALFTSDSPEWYTPKGVIDRTVKLLGRIDLDPCSNNRESPNVPAAEHFTAEDDGLGQDWHGLVYLNPPYGNAIGQWVEKLVNEHRAGGVGEAVALLPARTDTAWFAKLRDWPRCFVSGRLRFSDHQNSAPFPSVIVYLGERLNDFHAAFSDLGDIYVRVVTQ